VMVHIHESTAKYAPAIHMIAVVILCSLILPLIAGRRLKAERCEGCERGVGDRGF
jgi:hypothetical protein